MEAGVCREVVQVMGYEKLTTWGAGGTSDEL